MMKTAFVGRAAVSEIVVSVTQSSPQPIVRRTSKSTETGAAS